MEATLCPMGAHTIPQVRRPLRFLRRYRGDCTFAIKELSLALSKPTANDQARLKRVARYLSDTFNVARWVPADGSTDELCCHVDSNWAGDKVNRKSTSSYSMFLGGCNLVDSSKGQAPIATSSGEAEWCAACGGATEALHMAKLARFVPQGHQAYHLDGQHCLQVHRTTARLQEHTTPWNQQSMASTTCQVQSPVHSEGRHQAERCRSWHQGPRHGPA